jgi:DNA adenine methylase
MRRHVDLAVTDAGTESRAHPFLKWVGAKDSCSSSSGTCCPTSFERYFEPFLGGGAVFFSLAPRKAVLSDVNGELVDCYRAIRDSVDDVIEALGAHRYEKEHYYEVRSLDPASLALPERAARTVFLNRSGYNGLYRVNQSGAFNVPFGRYSKSRRETPRRVSDVPTEISGNRSARVSPARDNSA